MIYNRLIVAAIGFIRLEPYDGKLSRTVLRGGKDSNALLLPDYASVEMLHHPEFAGMPLAVGGDPEARHGIVLTANYIAKKKGVKTGMALWQAKQVCPEIIFVPPRMDLYLRFSQMAREIYSEYTDKIEPYGIDEAWLDVSDSGNLKGSGMTIAREISHRIKYELGVTVSIGISWNKIYAKLGSDYKKPDAITEFNRENYKDRIWQLPASDLLYVGRQTNKKLQKLGIRTIGQLAESDEKLLESHFGKIGNVLWAFANGWDEDPVCKEGYEAPVKSIGNSTTTPRDLENDCLLYTSYGVQFDVYYDSHAAASAHGHQTWECYLADDNGSNEVEVTRIRDVDTLNVTLTSGNLMSICQDRLGFFQKELFSAYNDTKGNLQMFATCLLYTSRRFPPL